MILIKALLLLSLFQETAFASKDVTHCLIAKGYPPYQYLEDTKIKGIDPKIVALYNKYNPEHLIKLTAVDWSDTSGIVSFGKKFKCIWGMEITNKRQKSFYFTGPIYYRISTLFTLKSSPYSNINDLKELLIGDDKDSNISRQLDSTKFRKVVVKSKRQAFLRLKRFELAAFISPYRVGTYLAKSYNTPIRSILKSKEGQPVSVATKDLKLSKIIEKGLLKIPKRELDKILAL